MSTAVNSADFQSHELNNNYIQDNWEHRLSITPHSVEWQMQCVLGKLLTILDAVVADPRQNKATKDLVRTTMSQAMATIRAQAMPAGMAEGGYRLRPSFDWCTGKELS